MRRFFWVFCILLVLVSCGGRSVYAPVIDIDPIEKIPIKGVHRVQPGETLYAIAWRYGIDYRELAEINRIQSPWRVWVGETIYLRKSHMQSRYASHVSGRRLSQPKKAYRAHYQNVSAPAPSRWLWPAKGRLIGGYSTLNRGLNIAGHLGEPIFATASGRVVYAGDGLRGYGNLIIIKHNNAWLSAYAQNQTILVREGDWVTAGRKITTMGGVGRGRAMLHFEIRYNGKPVNPLRYLKGV